MGKAIEVHLLGFLVDRRDRIQQTVSYATLLASDIHKKLNARPNIHILSSATFARLDFEEDCPRWRPSSIQVAIDSAALLVRNDEVMSAGLVVGEGLLGS